MKSCWITYQDKQILYGDFRNLKPADLEQLDAELKAVQLLICLKARGSVLMLCDIRDSVATTEAMPLWKDFTRHIGPHMDRLAVVGVSGFKKVLFDALVRLSGMNAVAIDDMDQALAWLVE